MKSLSIVIVGAGNLANQLACALYQSGHTFNAIFSRQESKARQLADRVGQCIVTSDLKKLPTADVYILAVADDAIDSVACQLPTHCHQGVVVHTSGSTSSEVLADFPMHGVFYPLQSFTSGMELSFSDLPIFIEGNTPEVTRHLEILAQSISTRVQILASPERERLHLAAVFANNFINHLCEISESLLQESGVRADALQPLLRETLRKQTLIGAHNAQTGPARRGDISVINRHLSCLVDHPEWRDIYDALSNSIIHNFSK